MKQPSAPRLDQRREKQFETELFARARAWIPSWGMDDDGRDFGRALLKIAARFSSEVAERLDRAGDKLRLGFLDWLAVQGKAARPARLPVVFKLADNARDAVLATEGARLQVEAAGKPVILETEKDVYLLPRQLKVLVGVDAAKDAFFLSAPGISSLLPLEPLPVQWRLRSFASAGTTKLQLDPELGLASDMLIELGGQQYRIEKVDKDIVTLDPALTRDQAERSVVRKVTAFDPFDGAARNQQHHALYLGHKELLDIESAATIEIVGAKDLKDSVSWYYWGKNPQSDEVGWYELPLAGEEEQAKSDAIVLEKPHGSMEILELAKGTESRWIRASVGTLASGWSPLLVDTFEIRINCLHVSPAPAPVPSDDASASAPAAEAMANTTPLVLDGTFYPFGKEPRQFDAFYLGSKEAFSKESADIALDFEMADTTFAVLTGVRNGAFADTVLAGVARDGALYVLKVDAGTGTIGKFRDRGPLRPPPPEGSADVAVGVALDRQPRGRLPLWHDREDPDGFLIAARAMDAVWVWREQSGDKEASRWTLFGTPPTGSASPNEPISDLVYLADASTLVALRGGQLSVRKWPDGAAWTPVDTKEGPGSVVLDAIVPILTQSSGSLVTSAAAGMVGISTDRRFYHLTSAGACSKLDVTNVDRDIRPVAVLHGGDLIVALMHVGLPHPTVFRRSDGEKEVELEERDARVLGFDTLITGSELHFLASVQLPSGGYLASWMPPSTGVIEVFRAEIPAGFGRPAGAPTRFGGRVVIPGTGGHVLSSTFNMSQRFERQAAVGQAVFVNGPGAFQMDDILARAIGDTEFSSQRIAAAGTTPDSEAFYLLSESFDAHANGGELHAFHATAEPRVGAVEEGKLVLQDGDLETRLHSVVLMMDGRAHRISDLTEDHVATLIPPASDGSGNYWTGVALTGRVSPFMSLNTTNNDWDAALLKHATLRFKGASPLQRGTPFQVSGNRPLLVELSSDWVSAPAPAAHAIFVLDAVTGLWMSSLDDTSTNPELSWEYWNGTGWWKLTVTRDDTRHLKTSGKLKFEVPSDLAPTDWSGKTNFWIRARLIGGDYGREKVWVETSPPDKDGGTTQTVKRSSADIRAPSVVKLGISYEVCKNVPPTFVLTKDGGSLRDQSNANRTSGARVEAFVPLGVLLGRLSGPANAPAATDNCARDCSCPATTTTDATPSATPVTPAPAGASTPAPGRAVYMGFDAPLSGAPVNVLLLVDQERPHDTFAPITVEALTADRFVPIVASDTTRALGESGVLSLTFALEPTPRDLFGQSLTWLRLTPRPGESADGWKPAVRGAYLNAVWASAAETLTYELVGSSQGEPNLTFFLARPPVLEGSLELRVKEPLGEEERKALNAKGKDQVLSAVENLPGDWVLWRRVTDPADELPAERVYALDEATGEIRFGDGRHGKLPPVGRDSIVAFKYRRTEAGAPNGTDVPANKITARMPLNLVSPISGVEAVFAADQAAGGAPAEDTERVLRFGVARLRHRERAVTARDIEDLALESSPDIAQARCFLRKGFVRLVIVMRGADPVPSAAQLRELHRLLLAASPPSLSGRQALRIGGPSIRRLRVDLRLRVASLDDAGSVARDARQRIVALFDTMTGGPDADGWALGENLTEADIALALADVPRLESIACVKPREITGDGTDQPWPKDLKPTELAMPHKDVIRVEFEVVEVIA